MITKVRGAFFTQLMGDGLNRLYKLSLVGDGVLTVNDGVLSFNTNARDTIYTTGGFLKNVTMLSAAGSNRSFNVEESSTGGIIVRTWSGPNSVLAFRDSGSSDIVAHGFVIHDDITVFAAVSFGMAMAVGGINFPSGIVFECEQLNLA